MFPLCSISCGRSMRSAIIRVWESHGLKNTPDQSLEEEHFISCARCGTHVHTKACA